MNLKNLTTLKILAALSILFQFFTLWLHWPGIFSWDILNFSSGLHQDTFSYWYSFTYSFILLFFYKLAPHPSLPLGFSILVQNLLFYYFFAFSLRKNNYSLRYIYVFYFIFNFWPYFLINNIHLDRDLFAATLQVALLCYFLLRAMNKAALTKHLIAEASLISALTVLAAEIRQDSIFLLLVIPIYLKITSEIKTKEAIAYILVFLVFSTCFLHYLPQNYSSTVEIRKYQSTAFLNPLEEMITEGRLQELSDSDQKFIAKVFSNKIQVVKDNFRDISINSLHQGHFDYAFAAKNWPRLTSITFKLFIRNPMLFLTNRARMLLAHLGFYGNSEFYWDAFNDGDQNIKSIGEKYYNIYRSPENAKRVDKINRIILTIQSINWLGALLLSMTPALLIAVLLLSNWRLIPTTLLGMTIIWIRFPILLLCAPASSGKYFHSLMLGTLICFVFSFFEHENRQKPALRS